jgi:hypothetical protein
MADLMSVIVGGVIGVAASWVPHWWEQRRAKARARAMALAYVDGVLKMEERRQHGELRRLYLESLRKGIEGMPKIFGAENYPNPNEVQKVIIGQLSHLKPDDARDMVLFLNMGDGLDADDAAMSTGKMASLTREQRIAILEGDQKLGQEMLELGRELVLRLGGKTQRRGLAATVDKP